MRDTFEFAMNTEGYGNFVSRIPTETGIAFESTGLAYAVDGILSKLGYIDIAGTYPK